MEQIIVTRKDGTTYPLASKKEVTSIKDARQSWGLLGDDIVNLTIESPRPQRYEIGDYFSVFGRTYKLNQLPIVRKGGTYKFTYELTFEGVQYDLLRAFYDVTIETTGNTLQDVQGDALTGNLHRFATVLVSNANRVFPNKWKLGVCPDTIADKTLTFGDGDNCLAVFQNLCKTFEVEASITQSDGIYTIDFYKRVGTSHPFVFEFGKGKGLYALDRQNVDSSNIVTRLKVFGSHDNITNKYRANRLCLPDKSKAQSFIEQSEAVKKYGVHEARKIFDDIKPTFNGEVTAVISGSVLQFKDTSMFDLNAKEADGKTTKYLVAGVSAKIHFNSGNLAGYEFDIHKYDHATRTFTLKKQTDDHGYIFPSEISSAFQFAVGDKYKILDVTLPEQYQIEAERRLQERANEYYKQNSQPKVKYGLSVAKSYLKKMFGEDAQVTLFSPGDYINIKDESIGVDKAVRIQSLVRNLLDVYDYTLTLSDVAENNITTRVISELIDIDKITTTHQLKDPARAKANWRSSREVMDMVFDPEGDYYTDKIKPNSIDTLALSVGAKSMQFALQNVVFEPNYQGQKNTVRISTGTLTHYTIEEQPKVWVVAQAIAGLRDDASAYYIFAKCDKASNSASIIFSKEPIKTEEVVGFYHFWVGVVNSVDATLQARSIALSYGFSTINGRFIKTGRIESADGATYFDLEHSEIGGNIRFKGGKDADTFIAEALQAHDESDYLHRVFRNGTTEIGGGLVATSVIALKDAEGVVRAYLDGRGGSSVAFGAGVSNFGASNEARNVTILHDGTCAIGEMRVERGTGRIRFEDSAGAYLSLGGTTDTLNELVKQRLLSIPEQTYNVWGLVEMNSYYDLKHRFGTDPVYSKFIGVEGFRLRVRAMLTGVVYNQAGGGTTLRVVAELGNGSMVTIAETHLGRGEMLYEYGTHREPRSLSFSGEASIPRGSISRVWLEVVRPVYASLKLGGAQITIGGDNQGISKGAVALGGNGLVIYLGRDEVLSIIKGQGLRYVGKADMPGWLASATVDTGVITHTIGGAPHYNVIGSGAKVNAMGGDRPLCKGIAHGTHGYYLVHHSVGHTNYSVSITVHADKDYLSGDVSATIWHKGTTTFWVYIRHNGGMIDKPVRFDYTIMGSN